MKFWNLLMNETKKLLPFKVLKTIQNYFRVTQSFNHYVGLFMQRSDLYMSTEYNFVIQILIRIILKYVVISVVAITAVKFRGSTREVPKNRSKFTKNFILDLFQFPVHKRFNAVQLLGFVGDTETHPKWYGFSRSGP